jgi:hypothetical protein
MKTSGQREAAGFKPGSLARMRRYSIGPRINAVLSLNAGGAATTIYLCTTRQTI